MPTAAQLDRNALARVPLTREMVRHIYTLRMPLASTARALCESHERLRMELAGAMLLLEEAAGRKVAAR